MLLKWSMRPEGRVVEFGFILNVTFRRIWMVEFT